MHVHVHVYVHVYGARVGRGGAPSRLRAGATNQRGATMTSDTTSDTTSEAAQDSLAKHALRPYPTPYTVGRLDSGHLTVRAYAPRLLRDAEQRPGLYLRDLPPQRRPLCGSGAAVDDCGPCAAAADQLDLNVTAARWQQTERVLRPVLDELVAEHLAVVGW